MKRTSYLLGAALLLGCAASTKATTVNYDLTSIGANQWKYTYEVKNDSLSDPIADLLIFFPDINSADNFSYTLDNVIAPSGWTPFTAQPSSIDLGGYAEWFGGSIAPGDTASGFEVDFTYTGTASLGSQKFQIYDANFNVADEGQTRQAGATVPDQTATLTYAVIGCAALLGLKRRVSA